jgi:hypothetical protein
VCEKEHRLAPHLYFLLGFREVETRENKGEKTKSTILFSSWFWRSQNKRQKKGCYCRREKNKETKRHLVLAKEEFVFLSFVFPFGE